MNNYKYCMTRDGSVGLYNYDIGDIYHSSAGALTESIQKFIIPSELIEFVKTNSKVRILDICYGIGYNSKAALYLSKKHNNKIAVHIDAIETNEDLVLISPFVKDTIPSIDTKLFLSNQLFECDENRFNKVVELIRDVDNKFLNKNTPYLIEAHKKNNKREGNYDPCRANVSLLHNIYYQYISNSIKNSSKHSSYKNSTFNVYCNDARVVVPSLKNTYDFVFLDAFTPQKDPTLWTFDFLSQIKSKMHDKAILITYSNSTPFRSALIELGFNVGKVLLANKQYGTIASMSSEKIINPLDTVDIGLTKTKGGIFFKDPNLRLTRQEIISNHLREQKSSNRPSTSSFKKGKILL